MTIDTSIQIGKMKMKNPVTVASGTYGQGTMFQDFYDVDILGALTTKSVTLEKRAGNPPPRIYETSSGYLNAIGLQNPGVKYFIKEYKEWFEFLKTPIIISIAGTTVEEYGEVAKILSDSLPIQGIEINISCPNVQEEGLQFACSPKAAAQVVEKVRKSTPHTVITKLTPNTDQNVAVAKACEEAGSDGIAAINTLKAMAIDLERRKPRLANVTGGLSGPCIKPVALRWVYEIAQEVSIPLIGMGGIETAEDALEFIVAGATAISLGTVNFYNPEAVPQVIKGIEDWMKKHDISSLKEIRNSLNL